MTGKRGQIVSMILGIISLIAGAGLNFMLADFDDAVIRYGYATASRIQTLSNVLLGLFAVMAVLFIVLKVTSKAKTVQVKRQDTLEKKTNPHYDEKTIMEKLDFLERNEQAYRQDLAEAARHIRQINDCLEDLQELKSSNEYEMLDKISFSMNEAKTQILQNAKSIINRVTVEGDRGEIGKKLENSTTIIKQVKALLNETVNYLDTKSPTTSADLENMTKALQSLNQTME